MDRDRHLMARTIGLPLAAAVAISCLGAGAASAAADRAGRLQKWGQKLEERFAKLDRNADGALDRTELEAPLAARFDRLDANKDGVLDEAELKSVRERIAKSGGGAAAKAEARMKRADANGDGKLSRDEYLSMLPPWFVRADADKDEKVTKAELDGFIAKRRKADGDDGMDKAR